MNQVTARGAFRTRNLIERNLLRYTANSQVMRGESVSSISSAAQDLADGAVRSASSCANQAHDVGCLGMRDGRRPRCGHSGLVGAPQWMGQ